VKLKLPRQNPTESRCNTVFRSFPCNPMFTLQFCIPPVAKLHTCEQQTLITFMAAV